MSLGLSYDIISGEFEKRMKEMELPIALTATEVMDEVKDIVKREGRADIARAGFSKKWQNALRVDRYPKGRKKSVEAAVFVHHNIQYAGVFEEGATIHGSPLLWLPTDEAPKRIGRNRMTPANFERKIGHLVSLTSRKGTPLLGYPIRLSKSNAAKTSPKITMAAIRRGKTGKGTLRTVAMFVGIRKARIHKQFSIRKVCENARDRIPTLYAAIFSDVSR